jgi:acyl-coenzyme A thioesterase PaaI-like protein
VEENFSEVSGVSVPDLSLYASHAECFACGVSGPNGLGLHFLVGADMIARATWQPSMEFRSYPDRIHGGVLATLVDSAIVHALFAQGVAGVTAELGLRFIDKVDPNEPVQVNGWVEKERHGVFFCAAEVVQRGTIVVRAHGKFMPMTGQAASSRGEELHGE